MGTQDRELFTKEQNVFVICQPQATAKLFYDCSKKLFVVD
jgi:hypothetical protein